MEDGWDTYSEKLGYRVEAHLAFSDVRPEEYDALIIPGGRAPEYIRNDEDVKSIVRYFFDNNLPVAHLCHAPLVLAAAGVLDNRETAAFPFLQPDVELAGAAFVDSEAVVDGNMVSARAWFDHPAWMRAFIEVVRSSLGALPNETSRTQESELRHLRKRLSEIEQRIDHLARG
jgi:protease I